MSALCLPFLEDFFMKVLNCPYLIIEIFCLMKNLKSQQVRTVVWMGECSPFFSGTRHLWGREKTGGNQSSTNSPFCPRNIPIWLSMVPFHTQQLMVVMDCFKVDRTAHNHGHQHLGRFFESFIDLLAEQTLGGQMD